MVTAFSGRCCARWLSMVDGSTTYGSIRTPKVMTADCAGTSVVMVA